MKFRILDAALRELRGATKRYREIRPPLGQRFKDAVATAFDRIEQWPLSGSLSGSNVRICRVKRFPYGIVYVPRDAEIVVVAIMHLHRRPGYWKRRLKGLDP
jgi:plasmid stabilization system protein ParE